MKEKPKYCYRCGAPIMPDDTFCHKCGTNLKSGTVDSKRMDSRFVLQEKWLKDIKQKYDVKKLVILIFIVLSILMNCIWMPWIRIFPNTNNIGMGHRNQTQVEYSTIFYKPSAFSDGWSSQEPGTKDSRGVYLGYDYKRIAIHECILAGIFVVVYLVATVKRR